MIKAILDLIVFGSLFWISKVNPRSSKEKKTVSLGERKRKYDWFVQQCEARKQDPTPTFPWNWMPTTARCMQEAHSNCRRQFIGLGSSEQNSQPRRLEQSSPPSMEFVNIRHQQWKWTDIWSKPQYAILLPTPSTSRGCLTYSPAPARRYILRMPHLISPQSPSSLLYPLSPIHDIFSKGASMCLPFWRWRSSTCSPSPQSFS